MSARVLSDLSARLRMEADVLLGPDGRYVPLASVAGALRLAASEIDRLRTIENIAMRVAGSRRNGIVTDQSALDGLDAALEEAS